ncbi:hypothetical protein OEZ86_009249 [Tetradesmus obliquus]|nr:hypothetical protein OEZ86_009249 [Tetradesmus obliquus]
MAELAEAGSRDTAALQAAFTQAVHKHHDELCSRGMNPNEACALALRAAAGQVLLPVRLSELYEALKEAESSGNYQSVCSMIRTFFASPDALQAAFWPQQQQQQQDASDQTNSSSNGSSLPEQPQQPTSSSSATPPAAAAAAAKLQQQPPWLQIDPAAVQQLHDRLEACHSEAVRDALLEGGQQLLLHISDCFHQGKDNPGFCRQVCGLLANPWLQHMECHHLLAAAAGVLVELGQAQFGAAAPSGIACGVPYSQQLQQLLQTWQAPEMRRVVALLQQYITLTLYQQQAITPGIEAATRLLGLLEKASSQQQLLDMAEFYNDAVNEPDFNIKEDYKRWNAGLGHFSFCGHSWIYDPASKSRILQLENQMQQLAAFENSMMQALMGGARESCPFLLLRVRRGSYLLRDTLMQINNAKNNGSLKKPLKVKFIGEEGVDEGGLQKEFFQLLVRECFNPEFGMFVYSEETHLHWFHASSMDLDTEFELIGILIGLAIYNSHILEFQFPLVLYKKLMGQPLSLPDDLAELHPEIHASLGKLAAMSDDELAGMGLTFQVETEVGFGERVAVDLVPNGSSMPVTAANVQRYISAYAEHLLKGAIARQFGAFQRGFLRLCSGKALHFFRPAELEQLVCGGRVVDLSALQAATQYDDGYSQHSTSIRWFWEVVHSLDDAQQKRLLFFITGSDRVPIKGLAHLSPPFVISRNGNDSTRLPTAHTCFNHLLLPAYKDKDTMRQRLLLAIENAEGFGLL